MDTDRQTDTERYIQTDRFVEDILHDKTLLNKSSKVSCFSRSTGFLDSGGVIKCLILRLERMAPRSEENRCNAHSSFRCYLRLVARQGDWKGHWQGKGCRIRGAVPLSGEAERKTPNKKKLGAPGSRFCVKNKAAAAAAVAYAVFFHCLFLPLSFPWAGSAHKASGP